MLLIYSYNILGGVFLKYVENARVVSTEFLQKGICNLVLECPKIAKDAKPGQFIEILSG